MISNKIEWNYETLTELNLYVVNKTDKKKGIIVTKVVIQQLIE
jgi:hypothetical protein